MVTTLPFYFKIIICLGFLCLFTHVQAEDEWTGTDKTKHFALSTAFGAAAYAVTENRRQAFLLALAPGLLKEAYDSTQPNNHFSGKDMAWNALGAAVGVQTGFLLIQPNEISVSWRF